MRTITCVIATAAALASATGLQASEKMTGEQRLAKILEGREAGAPVDCIPLNSSHNTTVIDKTAIVYDAGTTIYVNRPKNADQLDDDLVMVSETHTGQLCKIDAIKLQDRSDHMFRGFVTLEQFVPYRKPEHHHHH